MKINTIIPLFALLAVTGCNKHATESQSGSDNIPVASTPPAASSTSTNMPAPPATMEAPNPPAVPETPAPPATPTMPPPTVAPPPAVTPEMTAPPGTETMTNAPPDTNNPAATNQSMGS